MSNEVIGKKLRFLSGSQGFVQDSELKGIIDDKKKTANNIYKLSDHDLEMVSAGTDQDNTGGNTGEISKYGSTCPDCKDSTEQTQLPSGQWLCGNCQLIC